MIKILADKVNSPDGATVEIKGNGNDILDEAVTIIDGLTHGLLETVYRMDSSKTDDEEFLQAQLSLASTLVVMVEANYRKPDDLILRATHDLLDLLTKKGREKKENEDD